MRAVLLFTAALVMIAAPAASIELTDAELLALEISGELLPPEAMVAQIDQDLAAVRAANPYLESICARASWAPGELLLELDGHAVDRYLAGEYDDLDDVNEVYWATGTGRCRASSGPNRTT